jgi:glucans biosynthesis protein
MWLWGDGLKGPVGDHRPEVHDADGLQVQTFDGNWLWRTLCQQTYPSLIHLKFGNGVKGFGLIQRDTNPNHYLDDEARYDIRPSVWIEPRSDWGPGAIELLELPAPHEGIDNIAAWWVPEQRAVPGQPVDMSYRVSFCAGDRPDHQLGKGVAYRVDRSQTGQIGLEIDFNGPVLAKRSAGSPPFAQVVSVRGDVPNVKCQKQENGVWTVSLDVKPTGEGPVELTVVLKDGDQELTETWACLCPLRAPPVSLPPWKRKQPEQGSKP